MRLIAITGMRHQPKARFAQTLIDVLSAAIDRVALMCPGPLEQDIARSVRGLDKRYVFQGVHMLFDGRPDRPWENELRQNKMIFIGRNLDRAVLENGFRECLAS